MSMARLVAGATAAMALSFAVPSQAAVDINGGLSWGGQLAFGGMQDSVAVLGRSASGSNGGAQAIIMLITFIVPRACS